MIPLTAGQPPEGASTVKQSTAEGKPLQSAPGYPHVGQDSDEPLDFVELLSATVDETETLPDVKTGPEEARVSGAATVAVLDQAPAIEGARARTSVVSQPSPLPASTPASAEMDVASAAEAETSVVASHAEASHNVASSGCSTAVGETPRPRVVRTDGNPESVHNESARTEFKGLAPLSSAPEAVEIQVEGDVTAFKDADGTSVGVTSIEESSSSKEITAPVVRPEVAVDETAARATSDVDAVALGGSPTTSFDRRFNGSDGRTQSDVAPLTAGLPKTPSPATTQQPPLPTAIIQTSFDPKAPLSLAAQISEERQELRSGVALVPSSSTPVRVDAQPPATFSAPPTEPRAIVQQIAFAVSQIEGGRTEVRLEPVELGRVTLTFTANDDGTLISVFSDRTETADLLRRNSELLLQAISDSSLGDVDLEFTNGDERPAENAPTPASNSLSTDELDTSAYRAESKDRALDIRV